MAFGFRLSASGFRLSASDLGPWTSSITCGGLFRPFGALSSFWLGYPRLTAWAAFFRRFAAGARRYARRVRKPDADHRLRVKAQARSPAAVRAPTPIPARFMEAWISASRSR